MSRSGFNPREWNLSLGVKLWWAAAALALMAGGLLALLVAEQHAAISFSKKEILGNQYHQAMRPLYREVLRMKSGGGVGSLIRIKHSLASLDKFHHQSGRSLEVDSEFRSVDRATARLLSDFALTGKVSSESVALSTRALYDLQRAVGDKSNLILDPDLDSYYMMELTLITLPREQEILAENLAELKAGGATGDEKGRLIRFGVLESMQSTQARSVAVAQDNSSLGNLASVRSGLQRTWDAVREHFGQGTADQQVAAGEKALALSHESWDTASSALGEILEERVLRMEMRQRAVLGVVITICALLLALCGGLFRETVRTARVVSHRLESLRAQDVTSLEESLEALAEGDATVVADPSVATSPHLPVNSTDELGALSRSLNMLQDQLVRAFRCYAATQKALSSAQRSLKHSEVRFRTMIESLNEGIIMVTDGGDIHFANRKVSEIMGFPEGTVPKRVTEILTEDIWRSLQEKSGQGRSTASVECQLLRYNHRKWWAQIQSSPIALSEEGEMGSLLAITDITSRKSVEDQLRTQAFHDPLTGLANRSLFLDRLNMATARMQRTRVPFAVIFLDLDNFKVVNDSLGHESGDCLLIQIAGRLKTCTRKTDTVARLGGDEFTILLEDLLSVDQVFAVVDRIKTMLKTPITLNEQVVYAGGSIGVAIANDPTLDAGSILRNADIAMYRAKQNGKGRCEVFDDSMMVAVQERLEIENDLRSALDKGELSLAFQPICNLGTRAITEFEALLRWSHPARGFVSPAKFIPVAEESGLIIHLGEWVLYRACEWARDVNALLPMHQQFCISVNLSVIQLKSDHIIDIVQKVLEETGLDAGLLKIEITESLMLDDPEDAVRRLRLLKELGIRLAVDDFGTGYSSMGYLKQMPIDTLKIDRTFVVKAEQNPEDQAIISAIIQMAKTLNLTVTGEGIETHDQAGLLTSLGCTSGQGFLFAPPQSPERARELALGRVAQAA